MLTPERTRLQKYLQVALLVQAAGLLGIIALTFPDWLDQRLHPYVPCGLCLDLRGLAFAITATALGPIIALLLILSWRWRGPRLWPLALVAVIDGAAIFLTIAVIVNSFHSRTDGIPPNASAPPLLLLPALTTLALGINLVKPVRLKPLLAASTAGCIVLSVFLWFFAIRPVQQEIPGELSLPFSKTTVYERRDLGCQDHVGGWVDEHRCLGTTLMVYRGSGDLSRDQATIDRALAAQQQSVPAKGLVQQPPFDVGINRSDSPVVDPSNAGLCLIIADRVTPAPSSFSPWRCGMVTDYADIRAHWPASDGYAIGIIYYFERHDYVADHSVTFLNAPVGATPGHPATVRVHADPNTRCSIAVLGRSGQPVVQGLDPKTTDAAGAVDWTWSVDPNTPSGQWPIFVTCGSSSGRASWSVHGPSA